LDKCENAPDGTKEMHAKRQTQLPIVTELNFKTSVGNTTLQCDTYMLKNSPKILKNPVPSCHSVTWIEHTQMSYKKGVCDVEKKNMRPFLESVK